MESTEKLVAQDSWRDLLKWVRRFREWDGFDAAERDYKMKLAASLAQMRDELKHGSLDPLKVLNAVRTTNLVGWQLLDDIKQWAKDDPEPLLRGLRVLWLGDEPLDLRIERFAESIKPGSGSTPARLASTLLMAIDATRYPPFAKQTIKKAYNLTATPSWEDAGPGEMYAHALAYFQEVLDRAKAEGIALRDLLDAQSAIWCVVKYTPTNPPLPGWSDEDRRAFLAFRDGVKAQQAPVSSTPLLPPHKPDLSALADELLLNVDFLDDTRRLLEAKRQVVFYGPPGTGKTYVARKLAAAIAGPERTRLVQFHPSYTYEDFVEGYRPAGNGALGFSLVPGPLKQIAAQAAAEPDRTWILIIDELNRGNIAKVFGELFFLLEYRDESIHLQYSRDAFHLPNNLWVIGTMNTADRSIALMDAALRRRFYFVPFFPDQEPIRGLLGRWLARNKPDLQWLAGVVENANQRLGDPHVAIGPSHFMRPNLDDRWAELIWNHSILPTLQEHFFGREAELKHFAFEALRSAAIGSPSSMAGHEAAAAD